VFLRAAHRRFVTHPQNTTNAEARGQCGGATYKCAWVVVAAVVVAAAAAVVVVVAGVEVVMTLWKRWWYYLYSIFFLEGVVCPIFWSTARWERRRGQPAQTHTQTNLPPNATAAHIGPHWWCRRYQGHHHHHHSQKAMRAHP
jgi:hypothetical protein